ncbi:chemotaxis protein chec -- inhibitor of mcp methylation [hydrocarbon metagenome]|uniref:Chemotaxis protein chec--inhibitor of mcp methylation n=1 Tax=hydrocarbon metagenome TaxID=938273 RepID=A0A0W8FE29_9ZZZZ|nr:chemotaxis protein CheC [Methanomicrobiaceae archaeon]
MELDDYQADAFKELGNIGAAHAATTLSQMLMCPIELSVPEVQVVDIADLCRYIGDELTALIVFQVEYNFADGGFLVVYMPKDAAVRLADSMLGTADAARDLTEMDQSAVIEAGNIMVSAFLDATASLLDIVMLPSPPALAVDMAHAALESVIARIAADTDDVIIFSMEMRGDEPPVYCNIILLPNRGMFGDIIGLLEEMVAAA